MQQSGTGPKDVINCMKTIGFIPVFYHADANMILQVIKIAYGCGARVFEFLHQRDNRGLRIFTWLAEQAKDMPGLMLGAGTVLDAVMTERYIEAGAKFIVSPFLRKDMADVCQKADMLWMPGCSTQDDIVQAQTLGASVVMILPGNILGPEFLRKAVNEFSGLNFVPSGGIDISESSLRTWINAGALSVRLGDSLFERDALMIKDWSRIENNIHGVIHTIQKVKNQGRKNSTLNSFL
jgi:2-dehydro-3-deoxyphosphogluconate aldolase / (4S)-4-hydroxy-2-oxoglutarate aldolase